jgi:hypothetical protein
MWKIFKLEDWSYTFELADFFKENIELSVKSGD